MERFLKDLPAGSIGLDVGCGNGKNLMVNKDVFIVASDRYVLSTSTMGEIMASFILNLFHFYLFFLFHIISQYKMSSHSQFISTRTDPFVQIGKPGSDCNQAPAPFSHRG